ncbi:hypothetical protein M407DRAFT_214405 [Tulasnella calospora MUT 4182]|uniref:Mitochondrial splicing suppressor 51-like C-terminal domain-containing protein n=1 Tax=Tulasnella calospora MUT 4182 TaxID=1051891 RepID=A0A0C3LQ66_9AGAM|nr:hypothetical protein M407DRAFT_214405 [Tulasnella calospora MUT 4182]
MASKVLHDRAIFASAKHLLKSYVRVFGSHWFARRTSRSDAQAKLPLQHRKAPHFSFYHPLVSSPARLFLGFVFHSGAYETPPDLPSHDVDQTISWGRVESDGTFNIETAKERFGVLGNKDKSYWNVAGGLSPHLAGRQALSSSDQIGTLMQLVKQMYQKTSGEAILDGEQLLSNRILEDEEGWKLERGLIPYLKFADGRQPPKTVTSVEDVKDWESWYTRRGLRQRSPVALLISFPLTVYQLLVNVLEVIQPGDGSEAERTTLRMHYLGAEVELNYIPTFAELALLLPYTDIELVFFGAAVKKLCDKANASARSSLAGRASLSTPVYPYSAPKSCGSGTFKAFCTARATTGPLATCRPSSRHFQTP